MEPDWTVDFPTLGDLVAGWVERHCVVPDKHLRGRPFVYSDWQFWCNVNHYRVRPDASFDPLRPPLNRAFHYRRSQVMASQKCGKGPFAATVVAVEAAGPSQFVGWASDGDVYDCADQGCPCGWTYAYLPGEPMGGRHPSPLVQIVATSEDQVDNTFGPLRTMVKIGPLGKLMAPRENFIRILGGSGGEDLDRIDAVTSSADSRLGNPISFALQDETGLYVKSNKMIRVAETQRRGAAGMGGRTMETTNCFDPAEGSVAQRTFESRAVDVFRFYDPPPANLSYRNRRDRRRIHRYNYRHSPWVDIESIEAESAELLESDPAQAERFFGNRMVATSDAFFDAETWEAVADLETVVPDEAMVALGFDGSMYDDWTAIRARMIVGDRLYGFTPTFADDTPTFWNPADFGGEIPRAEVQAAVAELFERFTVVRFYLDPELWQSEIDDWAARYGPKVVVQWPTYRTRQMAAALERLKTDVAAGSLTHDADPVMPDPRAQRAAGAPLGRHRDRQTERPSEDRPGDG